MTQTTPAIAAQDAVIEPVETLQKATRCRCASPITKTLIASIVFAGAYAAFQRIGTSANASVVEYTRNLTGGFLAVGMTDEQPGFIALSVLDRDEVDVSAAQTSNNLAGTHTVVEIRSPRGTKRIRLRGPQVILVSADGAVETCAVGWTVGEFNTLREAADCSHVTATKRHRCGAPFTDLQEALAKWPGERVPDRVRAFLEPFKDRRTHH